MICIRVVLISIALMINNVEYLFMCLLAIHIYAHTLSVPFIPFSAFLILVIDFFLSSSF